MLFGVTANQSFTTEPDAVVMPTDGLLFWLKMDSISGGVLTDETGDHTGTIANATLVSGHLGDAINFNGTNSLGSIPHDAALNSAAFTVSMWVKTTTTGNTVLVEKNGNNGWSVQTMDASTVGFFGGSVGCIAIACGGGTKVLRSEAVVNDGDWHHVAVAIDVSAGTQKMYIDGANSQPASAGGSAFSGEAVTGSPIYTSGPISIGQRPTNIGPFGGSIDGVRYYSRALSAIEVATLYAEAFSGGGSGGVIPTYGLITRYTMGNISGSTLIDETGNHDGTITGATTSTGPTGSSLYFTTASTTYVDMGDKFDFIHKTCVFTISAWLKADAYNDTNGYYYMGNTATTAESGILIGYEDRSAASMDRAIRAVIFRGLVGYTTVDIGDTATQPSSGWACISIESDGTTLRVYSNTVLVSSASIGTKSTASAARNMRLGQTNYTVTTLPWEGYIGEVLIYDRALTNDERTAIYNAGV